MKGLLPFLTLFLLPAGAAAQGDDAPLLIKGLETAASTLQVSRALRCTDSSGSGFLLDPQLLRERSGRIAPTMLICELRGEPGCNSHSKLVFRFEGGGRLVLYGQKQRNCNGNAWFTFGYEELLQLARPIKSIRFVNGGDYQTIRHEPSPGERQYFKMLWETIRSANRSRR